MPLAFGYVYASWYIPFIYFNFFFAILFGGAVGYVLRVLARAGRLRSPALAGWLGAGVGAWAWYVQWCLYLTLLFNAGEAHELGSRASYLSTTFAGDTFTEALLRPDLVFGVLPQLAATGVWSLFGVTVSGFFLYLAWASEFLLIVLAASMLALLQAQKPFSELAGEWATKLTLPQPATHFPDADATKAALEAADWHHLQLLPSGPASRYAPFGRLHFYQAPSDPRLLLLVTGKRDH